MARVGWVGRVQSYHTRLIQGTSYLQLSLDSFKLLWGLLKVGDWFMTPTGRIIIQVIDRAKNLTLFWVPKDLQYLIS